MNDLNLAFRFQWAAFMLCGDEYNLIGEGFTTFPEENGSNEYTRRYVNRRTDRSDVTGYSPSIAYSCDAIINDPVVDEIMDIHDNERTGSQAKRTIVTVNCWEEQTAGQYTAYKRTYSIIPKGKGDDADDLIYTGTMRAASNAVKGVFVKETKEFKEVDSACLVNEFEEILLDEKSNELIVEE